MKKQISTIALTYFCFTTNVCATYLQDYKTNSQIHCMDANLVNVSQSVSIEDESQQAHDSHSNHSAKKGYCWSNIYSTSEIEFFIAHLVISQIFNDKSKTLPVLVTPSTLATNWNMFLYYTRFFYPDFMKVHENYQAKIENIYQMQNLIKLIEEGDRIPQLQRILASVFSYNPQYKDLENLTNKMLKKDLYKICANLSDEGMYDFLQIFNPIDQKNNRITNLSSICNLDKFGFIKNAGEACLYAFCMVFQKRASDVLSFDPAIFHYFFYIVSTCDEKELPVLSGYFMYFYNLDILKYLVKSEAKWGYIINTKYSLVPSIFVNDIIIDTIYWMILNSLNTYNADINNQKDDQKLELLVIPDLDTDIRLLISTVCRIKNICTLDERSKHNMLELLKFCSQQQCIITCLRCIQSVNDNEIVARINSASTFAELFDHFMVHSLLNH